MRTHPIAAVDLLSAVPEDLRDRLFPLLLTGPVVVAELTGRRAERGALHRWAKRGIRGVCLRTVTVGLSRHSTRRWLIEFFAAVDEARRAAAGRVEP